MSERELAPGIFDVSVQHADLKFFDRLMPTSRGTTYNSYVIRDTEKTCLIDPVDSLFADEHLQNLEDLGIETLDYIFCLHTEQDHAGGVGALLTKYPDAEILVTKKVHELMLTHLPQIIGRYRLIADGETISLGTKSLTVKSIPFAHWPDNTMLLLDRPCWLFSSDLFGSHYALADGEAAAEDEQIEQAKVYYAEIMMPYRHMVTKYAAWTRETNPEKILPAHGPVWHDPNVILSRYERWTSDDVSDRIVVIYVSMHESTRAMVERLTQRLAAQGARVTAHDIGDEHTDLRTVVGEAMHKAVNAAAVVLATPTVLGGPHPNMAFAAVLMNALKPKAKRLALMGSYGWGSQVEKTMKSLLSGLKAEWLDSVIIKGLPVEDGLEPIDQLADRLVTEVNRLAH